MFSGNVRPLGHAEEPPRHRGPVTPIQRYEIIRSFLRISVRNKAFASAGHDAAVRRPKTGTDAKRPRFEKRIVFPAHASPRIRTKPGEAPVSVRIPHFLRVPSGERSAEGSGTFPSARRTPPARRRPARCRQEPFRCLPCHPAYTRTLTMHLRTVPSPMSGAWASYGKKTAIVPADSVTKPDGRSVKKTMSLSARYPFLSGLQPVRFFHPKRSVPRTTICTSA